MANGNRIGPNFPISLFLKSFFVVLTMLSQAPLRSEAALSPYLEQTVDFEQQFNNAAPGRDKEVDLEHFEIPYSTLEVNVASDRISNALMSDLVFYKQVGGQNVPFVRWIINPEDTKYVEIVAAYLKGKGLDSSKHKYFHCYQTASRSWYCQGKNSNQLISLKVSTNKTGGNWQDKGQSWEDARDIRSASDYVVEAMRKYLPRNFVFFDEPVAFGIKDLDQAMILRVLGEASFTNMNKLYLPAFSALHETLGKEIAIRNGAKESEIAEYWNQNLNVPVAKALAELWVLTGMTLDSPHGQNFILELNQYGVPTGKVILKDLGDTYLVTEHLQATGHQEMLKTFYHDNVVSGYIPLHIGLLHGNVKPSWMSVQAYRSWGETFYRTFAQTVNELTGIPLEDLKGSPEFDSGEFSYHMNRISVKTPAFDSFFRQLGGQQGYRGR